MESHLSSRCIKWLSSWNSGPSSSKLAKRLNSVLKKIHAITAQPLHCSWPAPDVATPLSCPSNLTISINFFDYYYGPGLPKQTDWNGTFTAYFKRQFLFLMYIWINFGSEKGEIGMDMEIQIWQTWCHPLAEFSWILVATFDAKNTHLLKHRFGWKIHFRVLCCHHHLKLLTTNLFFG